MGQDRLLLNRAGNPGQSFSWDNGSHEHIEASKRLSPEVRERAVRTAFDHEREYESQWAAITQMTDKPRSTEVDGLTPELLPRVDQLLKGRYVPSELAVVFTYRSGAVFYDLTLPIAEAFKLEELFIQIRRSIGLAHSSQPHSSNGDQLGDVG